MLSYISPNGDVIYFSVSQSLSLLIIGRTFGSFVGKQPCMGKKDVTFLPIPLSMMIGGSCTRFAWVTRMSVKTPTKHTGVLSHWQVPREGAGELHATELSIRVTAMTASKFTAKWSLPAIVYYDILFVQTWVIVDWQAIFAHSTDNWLLSTDRYFQRRSCSMVPLLLSLVGLAGFICAILVIVEAFRDEIWKGILCLVIPF